MHDHIALWFLWYFTAGKVIFGVSFLRTEAHVQHTSVPSSYKQGMLTEACQNITVKLAVKEYCNFKQTSTQNIG